MSPPTQRLQLVFGSEKASPSTLRLVSRESRPSLELSSCPSPPPPITFELDSSFEKSSDPSSIPRVVRISPSPTSTAGAYGRSPSPRRTFGIKTSKDRGRTRPRTTRAMTTCPTQNPNIWSGSFLTALKEGYAKLVRIARMGAEMYRRTGAQK